MDRASPLTVPDATAARGITRLCHLTPFRNLLHLAAEGQGLLSLRGLVAGGGDYDQQDLQRLDGHPDHISCSIEYPNAWYLRKRKLGATPVQRLFPDWVCLTLDRRHLWSHGTRVCERNAAAAGGTLVRDVTVAAFEALYAPEINGAWGKSYTRSDTRISACPTDDQAEVLVLRQIPLPDVLGVIVATESDAKRLHAALDQIGGAIEGLSWAIAPDLFHPEALSRALTTGDRPAERIWTPR